MAITVFRKNVLVILGSTYLKIDIIHQNQNHHCVIGYTKTTHVNASKMEQPTR